MTVIKYNIIWYNYKFDHFFFYMEAFYTFMKCSIVSHKDLE